MEIYRFGKENGNSINHFDSRFILSRIIVTEPSAHIGAMYLEPCGVIGFHQATVPQLLLVVSGSGWVRCDSQNRVPVDEGDAIFWEEGEWHETTTDTGLMAIVIESEELHPERFMPLRE